MCRLGKALPMPSTFQIVALDPAPFQELFQLTDEELASRSILRYAVDSQPGFPCRVSLADLAVGEEALLLNFEHQPANTPYRSRGPIFVGRSALQARLVPNEVPTMLLSRPISVRGYDENGMMVSAQVVEGAQVAAQIREGFELGRVAYQHLHFARQGCFVCRVDRA